MVVALNTMGYLRCRFLLVTFFFASIIIRINGAEAKQPISLAGFPSATPEMDLINSITHRDINNNVVLKRAASIFQERLAASNPLQEAALDLLGSCKDAKEIDDLNLSQISEEKAKKLYAIRATIVDLTGASIDAPKQCAASTESARRRWYQSLRLTPFGNDGSSENDISACLKELFKVDNSWTSFVSHRQDANTLCEVPGSDNAARRIIELLNDVNGIIPDWIKAFRAEQDAHAASLERQQAFLQHIDELEKKYKAGRERDHEANKARMSELLDSFNAQYDAMNRQAHAGLSDLGGSVAQMQNDLVAYGQELFGAHREHEDLVASYRAAMVEALHLQQRGIENVDQVASGVIASYKEANAGLLSQTESFASSLQLMMHGAAEQQQQLFAGQDELASAQEETLLRQREALAFTRELEARVANAVGEMSHVLRMFEPAMRTVNAFASGNLGSKIYVASVCAAVTVVLSVLGFLRYASAFVACTFLAWTLPDFVLQLAGPINDGLRYVSEHISAVLCIAACSALLALVVGGINYRLASRRSSSRPSRLLSPVIHPIQLTRSTASIREMRRYQSVEPGMMWY
ncbi:uncharacterized protein HMPREF1541_05541 [Cyphellophora europaea CBS 101466]|uniref:Nuclear fusion protein KAR5 n=1 Tax=Cyphellophora europaea (strain CBS 101466) TaxID=1220924 RepID=W2RU72_CYPE1|nr:uncharacterized protein HMPREF1541_05541 [Cyphellophora europaea CBS 101466]ETN39318.1 hypothetical protein HMPREF1541_05541 [Cyphellophora europaea CBS 101466]